MKKIYGIFFAFAFIALSGPGCISIGTTTPQGSDGGVWKSTDKASNWAQINSVPTTQGIGNMNGINAVDLVFDPQDNMAIYLASTTGLFYTWDAGGSWKYASNLGTTYINSVAVAYNNKCTIYIAAQNRILKSIDCARSWQNYYFDTRAGVYVSYLAVNPGNSDIIFAGLSTGDLLRSTDKGASWTTINRFNDKIVKMAIHPKNNNLIFVGLQGNGLWRSVDGGKVWTDLRQKTDKFSGSNQVFDIDLEKNGSVVYLTSNFGIITSADNGENWTKIDLLTPPGAAKIYSLAINPNKSSEIYYSTASTLYSSFDGGKSWVTKKLPTSRAGTALLVDPSNSNLIYMGTRRLE
ncbi:MAG: hypothetical protein WC459_02745 [Patescibacteria group bacterium]